MIIMPAILVVQVLIVQFGRAMFRTEPLALKDWIIILLSTSVVLWAGEIFRFYLGKVDKTADIPDKDPFVTS
jgi:Ca2+-transporting ATPase